MPDDAPGTCCCILQDIEASYLTPKALTVNTVTPLRAAESIDMPLPDAGRSLAEMTYKEFVVVLKDALRNFHRNDRLTDSPLLRLRLLEAHAGPAELQDLFTQTVATLFASPRDEKLRRVIELTYFRAAPKQEVAAERSGLAFSTYRRHLTAGLNRVAKWLWEHECATPADSPKASLVIVPFSNLSGDPAELALVDGITENLTTDLSRLAHASIIGCNAALCGNGRSADPREIGRALGAQYVVEGSVQVDADRIRVSARFIDAETGAQLWADRFDKPRANLLDLQDEIAAHLTRSVDIELVAAESRRAMRKRRNELTSADLTLRASAVWNRPFTLDGTREARRLFEEALCLDDRNVTALLGVVDTHMREVTFYGSQNVAEQIRIADAAALRALELAPGSAAANYSRGTVLCAMRAPDCARHKFDVAISLDPVLASAHAYRGLVEIFLGRAEESERHVSRAIRLSPRDPMRATWEVMIGMAALYLDRVEEAVGHLQTSVGINPNCGWAQAALAVAVGMQGRDVEAMLACTQARRLAPEFTIAKYRREAMSDNSIYLAQREKFCAGLRRVGIPE